MAQSRGKWVERPERAVGQSQSGPLAVGRWPLAGVAKAEAKAKAKAKATHNSQPTTDNSIGRWPLAIGHWRAKAKL